MHHINVFYFTIMCGKFVCLAVCLFVISLWRLLCFESSGLRYMCPHLALHFPPTAAC